MAIPILAVAFTAFCVWLTVRVINRKERWAKCTLAGVVGVPVLYVASYGPVRAMIEPKIYSVGTDPLVDAYFTFYTPLFWVTHRNNRAYEISERYCEFCKYGH